MAPRVLALDISKTRTGVCDGEVGSVPVFYSVEGEGLSDAAAATRLFRRLLDHTAEVRPDMIVFEAQIRRVMKSSTVMVALAKMVAAVEILTIMRGLEPREVTVSTARKNFLGVGLPEDPKDAVFARCRAIGWGPSNDDESDAAAIWVWGCGEAVAHRAPTQRTKAQRKTAAKARLANRVARRALGF